MANVGDPPRCAKRSASCTWTFGMGVSGFRPIRGRGEGRLARWACRDRGPLGLDVWTTTAL
eukprot:6393359-Alexandrium_andersonii.AAC.1